MNLGVAAVALKDSLFNLISGLGTAKDPRQWAQYSYHELERNQLEAMYRSDWMARRIVDLPADDATREWRSWTAERPKLEKIDALERKLELQKKLRQALIRARLYGGGALVLGVDQGRPEEELDFDSVGKGDLMWVIVVNRYELSAGPRIYDVDSPYYTRPQWYTVATPMVGVGNANYVDPYSAGMKAGAAPALPKPLSDPAMLSGTAAGVGMVQMHPSRIIEFAGNELPDWRLAPMGGGWGDSILQTVDDSLKDFAMIMGGLANMVNDMKLDVIKVPELSRKLSTAEMTAKTMQRFGLANMAKSSVNTLLLDKDEDWDRIQTSFGSTPELIKVAMQVACAAGGVPESRLMGNAPNKGLQAAGTSGGEVDIRNYFDDVASAQKSKYKPALLPLDICIQRSALGTFDPGIDYEWNPLYRPDPAQVAATALVKAQTTQVYVGTGLINEDALRESVISQLTEDKIYPALEDALDEFGAKPEAPPAPMMPAPPNPPPGMLPKGQFDPNPFHMLRAQQAAKSGKPIKVPPNRPQPPKFIPKPPGMTDSDDDFDYEAMFDELRARGVPEAAIRDMKYGRLARTLDEDYRPAERRYARDFNPNHDPHTGEFTSGEGGGPDRPRAVVEPSEVATGGPLDVPHSAQGNYGLTAGDAEKYKALRSQWSKVNNALLANVDHPDGPEARAALDQMEAIAHQMHQLHADPGGLMGIKLPGGPRDVTIVGAGPGGMNAAINGGIEGLDTLLIEANPTAGGQAKFSSRIENLGGFPIGVSGKKLTSDMLKQANRLGAETKLGVRVTGMTVGSDGMKHLTLSNGETVDSRAVILAGGLEFKPMTFPGSDGPGVFVGDGEGLAFKAAGGSAVVVGGSNGAAQAALGAAQTANHVYVISRSPIKKGMSAYQVDALHNNPKVTLIEGDEVDSMSRDAKGNPVTVHTKQGQELPATAFGVFLGSAPKTDWLRGTGVEVDDGSQDAARHEAHLPPLKGKIRTDEDFETAVPGVFAVGDMRTKGAGRVGVAMGEGQQAIRHSWNYLEGLRHKAGLPSLTEDALIAPEDDTVMHDLISRVFALDKENPWFGQTVEPR